MKTSFTDKIIVISGGASGIGEELATQLAQAQATVIIADRDKMRGIELARNLTNEGYDVSYDHIDMTVQHDVEQLFDLIVKTHGRIDYVINDAGIFMGGEIRDTPLENWHTVITNNIFTVMNGTHYAYQIMLKQGFGHIVNLGSTAGLTPIPAMGIYGSTKYAIVGLSHALHNEAKDFGVKVSVVCPTIINTPLYDTAIYNKVNKRRALKSRDSTQSVNVAARRIIKGIANNKATIHTAVSTHIMWILYRITPGLYNVLARSIHRKYRHHLRIDK